MTRSFILMIAILGMSFGCAQRKQEMPTVVKEDPRWEQVDSLSKIGLYASALELTEQIQQDAELSADWRTRFRALMEGARFRQMTGAVPSEVINELDSITSTLSDDSVAHIPLKQLLHSALGTAYWNYYQQERWRILDRTNVEGSSEDAEMETWDQRMFMRKVIEHFQLSLQPFDTLRHIPAGELGELLQWPLASSRPVPGEQHSRSGAFEEPLLVDVLARRAVAIFTNSETRIAEPAWRFQVDDPRFFHLYENFAHWDMHHRDSMAWEYQALRTWQRWEQAHLADDHPIILTDVMLGRLAFVRQNITLPEKDSLYHDALTTMRSRVTELPIWSEVTTVIAQWHAERGDRFQRLDPGEMKWEKRTAVELCDTAIARYPDSFGAQKARGLRARLLLPSIDLQMEDAVLPEASFRAALGHTNVRTIWLRLVEDEIGVQEEYQNRSDRLAALLQRKVLKEWSVELSDDGDHHRHLTEIPVEGLPTGRYALLVSTQENMRANEGTIAYARFWSTRISIAERTRNNKLEALLLDRGTGKALAGAKAELYELTQDRNSRFTLRETATADAEGRVLIEQDKNRRSATTLWQIMLPDGDRYISGTNWSYYHEQRSGEDSLRTFLFTDRAIYRPGQEVHFKGITTIKRGNTTEVKAGYSTTVKLYDTNHQISDSIAVTSDAFGSFHGTFKAPGGLTGHMQLREQHGQVGIRVEEYKRPRFEVVFDPIETTAKLNEQAEVTGQAKSYAGVALDNAQVRWTVTRMARFPWWAHGIRMGGFPGWGRPVEVASGSTVTDGEGGFTIFFLAAPDQTLPRQNDPIFTYTVEANVTDITGETQSANSSLSLGYKSIEIDLGVGDALDRSTADSLAIIVRNLNGQRIDRPVDVRISRLQEPAIPLKDRKWERPDRFVITREAHSALFPFDPYDDEGDPLNWPQDSLVLERSDWNSAQRKIALNNKEDWPVGSYLISLKTTDPDGNVVKVEKHFTLYDPDIQNTGFLARLFHVEQLEPAAGGPLQPGDKARLLMSTALGEGRIGMEVVRDGNIVASRWTTLQRGQQLIEIPVHEEDRGGFQINFIAVAHGREFRSSQRVDVPWLNKELDVEWLTFRDKMLPGAKEEFRLKIKGAAGGVVAAQLLAAMYDASLDHFLPHAWNMFEWPQNHSDKQWSRLEPFSIVHGHQSGRSQKMPRDTVRVYPGLKTYGFPVSYQEMYHLMDMEVYDDSDMVHRSRGVVAAAAVPEAQGELAEAALFGGNTYERKQPEVLPQVQQPVRGDFRETAFFFPDLLTDRDGSIVLRFTMPEALTRWKLMGLAHTKDLQLAQFSKEVITQKPLMVVPNLPRFLREGDRITLISKVNVLEEGTVSGSVSLELFDPYSNAVISSGYNVQYMEQEFTAGPGASATASWQLEIPSGRDMIGIRIIARGNAGVSDGEEHILPILTDRLLVTESLPISISGAGTKSFSLDKLANSGSSNSLRHHSLKLEFTPNPGWYAVQALPYLIEFPHDCSEQVFSRYYANKTAAHIVAQRPEIKNIVEAWRASAAQGGEDLLSALEKNQELKSILLEESPWVMQAKDEGERKERIILLFDMERMAREEQASLQKLVELQMPNGAWPWFSGMIPSRNITQHIVAGIGHLQRTGAADLQRDVAVQQMLDRAIEWLDREADKAYKELHKNNTPEQLKDHVQGYIELQYLYARSFFTHKPYTAGAAQASAFIKERISAEWLKYGLQEQAMIALALHRLDGARTEVPLMVLNSMKERATRSDELGMYWRNFSPGMHWGSFPTETHALAIEAYHEIANDEQAVRELQVYLLNLKQTTNWRTTKATANACYALLLTGEDILSDAPAPRITVGAELVDPAVQEAGTGYFASTWSADQVVPAMGQVTVTSTADRMAWGALHWQYFEQMDKITPHESPFTIRKQVMLRRQTDEGARLLTLEQAGPLRLGDRLTIRIELITDRHVDYVHLKDLRAAGLEPVEALSVYKWQGGLGYYQSIRDAGMHFFFDRLPPGTHVFEYDLNVAQAGDFSNGITTAMCMYAPEFSSHSAGQRIVVGAE